MEDILMPLLPIMSQRQLVKKANELTRKQHPLNESNFVMMRGLIHQEVSPKCVNEENSTECRSYNRHVNRSPQL